MSHRERSVGIMLAATIFVARPARLVAETSLRCETLIVELGATTSDVERACGTPTTARIAHVTIRGLRGAVTRIEREVWTYDRGPFQFTKTLVFAGGRLESIDVGDYGR